MSDQGDLVDTPRGPARVHRTDPAGVPTGLLVLGHGAGGGVGAPDLLAVTAAVVAAGWTVVRVEQPYRVAGRRSPPPAPWLDEAWLAVLDTLKTTGDTSEKGAGAPRPLVLGGRSSGARVACRTAQAAGAQGVLCLAFPTIPPGKGPEKSRVPELDAAGVPVLVVQGGDDPFGIPPEAPGREVHVVEGDHSLKKDLGGTAARVVRWLQDNVSHNGVI